MNKHPGTVTQVVRSLGGKTAFSRLIAAYSSISVHPFTVYRWMKANKIPTNYKEGIEKILKHPDYASCVSNPEQFLECIENYSRFTKDEVFPDTPFTKAVQDFGGKSDSLKLLNAELRERKFKNISHLAFYHWLRDGYVSGTNIVDAVYECLYLTPEEIEYMKNFALKKEYGDVLE